MPRFKTCLLIILYWSLLGCSNNSSSQTASAVATDLSVEGKTTAPEPEKTVTTQSLEHQTGIQKEESKEEKEIEKPPVKTLLKEEAVAQKVKEQLPVSTKEVAKQSEKQSETVVKATSAQPKTEPKNNISEKPPKAVTPSPPTSEQLPTSTKPEKPAPPAPKILTHTTWDQLLRKYVSDDGKVNYRGLKADQARLDSYLADLAAHPVEKDWSRNKQMAYWINAYNAFTIKLIVENYPVAQITQLDGGKPWDKQWIKLGEKTYSLNDIEHKILRPQFNDPRIHFAVNCAAKSCPPVLNRAWTAKNLNTNFEKQTKSFINGPENEIKSKSVKLSKIFEWYREDFGDLIPFLNKYSDTPIKPNAEINFVAYNWDLNE